MTVIVMSKHKDHYYIHADGRCTQDWMGIASDEVTKVFEGKDFIFGLAGAAAAQLIIGEALAKETRPMQLLKLLESSEFKPYLRSCSALIATTNHGAYGLSVRPEGFLSSTMTVDIIRWNEGDLPQSIGSGFLNVRTLLSLNSKVTPELVKKAIKDSYKVNHTIGGRISETKLKISK